MRFGEVGFGRCALSFKKPGPRSLTQAGFLSASGLIRWRKPFAETTTGFDSTREQNQCFLD